MKRPLLLGLLCLGCALSIGTAWSAHRSALAAARRTDVAAADRVRLRRDVQFARERLARLQAQQRAPDAMPAKPAAPAPTDAKRGAWLSRLGTDPELQNLQLAARRAQLSLSYGHFYRTRRLGNDQIRALEANLIKREENLVDLWAMQNQQNLPSSDPVVGELYGRVQREYEAAQVAALGADGMAALKEYERTAVAREITGGMAAAAASAGVPLDADQVQRLTATLVGASRGDRNGQVMSAGLIDWAQFAAEARGFLSPAQLTFIETTEAQGLRGGGARFLGELHAAVEAAVQQEMAPGR